MHHRERQAPRQALEQDAPEGEDVRAPIDGQPATHGNGSTVGFLADSPAAADAWHAAGLANGGSTCEDPPGERAGSGLYLAYLRDPSGNKICALHRPG